MQQSFEKIKVIREELANLNRIYPGLFCELFNPKFENPYNKSWDRYHLYNHIENLTRDLSTIRKSTREINRIATPMDKYHKKHRETIFYIARRRLDWRKFDYELRVDSIHFGGSQQKIKNFIEWNTKYANRKYVVWDLIEEESLHMDGKLYKCRGLNNKVEFEDVWLATGPNFYTVTPTKLGCKRRYSNGVFNQIRAKLGD